MAPPIVVKILADAKEFTGGLDEAEGKLGKFANTGAAVGKALAVGVAGIGAAAVGAGVGLFKLGESFDASFDQIRVGTGATGDAMKGLEGDFKAVLRGVPTSFGDASTAIADLNTRLGLTGEPLQDLSMDFIQLSKVTGTDVAGNVDNMTRVFGDWGVENSDTSETLDKLFRASQNSGIGIEELSTSLVTVGAPLRNLGFGLDESAALLAVFNKTGVNTETVVAGLKAGVGKMAKAGEDVPETFTRIVDEITKLGPGTEATGLAIGLFGQRAGPDLADAIAGGKFAIDDMLAAITDGTETINDAEQDTRSFGEQWTLVKNRVLVKLEPIATKVFGAMGDVMAGLLPKIDPMFKRMEQIANDLLPHLQTAWDRIVPAVTGFVSTIRDGIPTLDAITTWMEDHRPIVIGVATAIGVGLVAAFVALAAAAWAAVIPIIAAAAPFIAVGIAIAGVTAAVIWAYENWGWFGDAVDAVVSWVKANAIPLFDKFIVLMGSVGKAFVSAFDAVKSATETIVRAISSAMPTITAVISTMVKLVVAAVKLYITWIKLVASVVVAAASAVAGPARAIAGFVADMAGDVVAAVKLYVTWVGKIGGAIIAAGVAVGTGVATVISKVGSVVGFVAGIPGQLLAKVAAWGSAGLRLGESVIAGIKNGLSSAAGFAGNVAAGVWTAVKNAINSNVIGPLNLAIPDTLGAGPFSVSLPANPIPKLGMGGLAGGIVDVGDRGPERVLLPTGSRVVPNHQIDATGTVVVNVATNADPWAIAREVAWTIRTGGR